MSNFSEGFDKALGDNPFSMEGFGKAIGGSVGQIGTAVGGLLGNAIGGSYSSKAGQVFDKLGDVGGMIPGPYGAIIGGGLKVVGGLANAAFGTKTNEAALRAANEGTNYFRNFTSTATSFDDVKGPLAQTDVQKVYSGGFAAKGKARRKNEALKRERAAAESYANRSVENNVNNIAGTQMDNLQSSFFALGGPLYFGTGAIGYDFTNQYLNSKNNTSLGLNNNLVSMPNSFQGLDTFAFGGELNTQGADFTNGLLHINNGGSHESNPYEGVPMGADAEGTPNLVEEGETVFNDYVFSNRIAVPKAIRDKYKLRGTKKLTFAEASKKLAKESEERPNDPISKRGLEASMQELMIAQEMLREKENSMNGNKFAKGGYTLEQYEEDERERRVPRRRGLAGSYTSDQDGEEGSDRENQGSEGSNVSVVGVNNTQKMPPPKARDTRLRYTPAVGLGLMTLTDALGWTNKPNYGNADAIVELGKAASTLPTQINWNPIGDYLAYNPLDRNYYLNQLAASTGATRRNILNTSGMNRGQALAGLLAADYNAGIQAGALARQAEEFNLEQRQKVTDFNRATNMANSEGFMKAALANQEAAMKARSLGLEAQMAGYKMREATRLAAEEDRAASLSGFINALGNIGRDNLVANQRDFAIYTGNPMDPTAASLVGYRVDTKNAKGGKLKKRKRGLTY